MNGRLDEPSIWLPATKLLNEYRSIRHLFMGDFYPLTPYSVSQDVWMAWQFDCPEIGEGMVQAFRREKNVCESTRFNLRGLEPDAHYTVKNMDAHSLNEITGRELMEKGLEVSIPNQPGAVIITYKKVK